MKTFKLFLKEKNISSKVLNQWKNEEPIKYANYLIKHFGYPNELTDKRAIWYNKDGFKRIEVLDEYILHASPLPHYDFVYCYIDLKVNTNFANKLAESSESIIIDFLKNEVGARCASLSANAVTLNYVLDVVEGRVTPSKKKYENRIKSMKNMFVSGKKFELDWWPDKSGDADPKNPYYKESVNEHFNCCNSIKEDWQDVNRKDKTDGLSQKAVNAYRRENPGSKLKTAVTEKNPTGKRASRRKSFCSRMGGMKKRLTNPENARDPDSPINKALRRWRC
jgi:hypothetical protein